MGIDFKPNDSIQVTVTFMCLCKVIIKLCNSLHVKLFLYGTVFWVTRHARWNVSGLEITKKVPNLENQYARWE